MTRAFAGRGNMAGKEISESLVRETALEWLATDYYQKRLDVASMRRKSLAAVREHTPVGKGGSVADGIIAVLTADGTVFTASLAAKSWGTLPDPRLQHKDGIFLLHSILIGGACVLGAAYVGWPTGHWFWRWVSPFGRFRSVEHSLCRGLCLPQAL